jgi:hypothetical protein
MYLITSPNGVDVPIQQLQKLFDSDLHPTKKVEVYGRAFHNVRDDGIVPECFVGGREYKEVLHDDTKDCVIFFEVTGDVTYNGAGLCSAPVDIIVQCNLKAIYPDGGKHATELIERDVTDIIDKSSPFHATKIVKGFPAVDMYANTDRARMDMYPRYCFRVKTTVNYQFNNC